VKAVFLSVLFCFGSLYQTDRLYGDLTQCTAGPFATVMETSRKLVVHHIDFDGYAALLSRSDIVTGLWTRVHILQGVGLQPVATTSYRPPKGSIPELSKVQL
jgi:hypothetical protein